MPSVTPMMKQYQEAKASCGDALLLFRMGDFYELFYEDAKTAARQLGLTLTSRDKGAAGIPMAGFPHHQLDNYLGKLITAGLRAAVCEQVEDPRQAKGLVRREVTRVVSPGTLTEDELLDPKECNHLAAIVLDGEDAVGVSWVDLSTGRFHAARFPLQRLVDEMARIQPSECLVSDQDESQSKPQTQSQLKYLRQTMMFTKRPAWAFSMDSASKLLTKHFQTAGLEGMGFDDSDASAVRAAGAVIDYLNETQKHEASLSHIDRLIAYRTGDQLEIDESTRRSLEMTRTIRDGGRDGSLLAVMDRTITPMGSRMLADWLTHPLAEIRAMNARLDAVEEMLEDGALCGQVRDQLKAVYDLERLVGRITTGRAGPRDLCFVGRTLKSLPRLKAKLTACSSGLLRKLEADLDLCPDICSQLERALDADCPLSAREGGFIQQRYNQQLDDLRELAAGGKQWIAQYQASLVRDSGIPSLKVGYNKVFGYYIEITNAQRDKVPGEFIRKQTLKNAERYITPELKEYEEKVVTADQEATDLEYELFLELRDAVAAAGRRLKSTAAVLATLDVLAGLSELARQRGYCRPAVVDEPLLNIVDGRHPILDVYEPEGTFVPNDTVIGNERAVIQIITGPNMAGKSTYIRQVALVTVMAQMGSFVPAREATIGVADRIFARVGASDELSRGQSTFMVEMVETARILNNASRRSLVILDEIGRGTSTYDGISLAWAIIEHIHDQIGCRTLFATHYHELTDLERSLTSVQNLNVAVKEWEDDVVFLHKIAEGAADKSYGIHVARLAGVPRGVNERAKEILAQLEEEHLDQAGRSKTARRKKKPAADPFQLTLFGYEDHPLLDKIRQLNLDVTSPVEAFQQIQQWQAELSDEPQVKPR